MKTKRRERTEWEQFFNDVEADIHTQCGCCEKCGGLSIAIEYERDGHEWVVMVCTRCSALWYA